MAPKRHTRPPRFDPIDPLLDGPAEATLDLHGCHGGEAEILIRQFVRSSQRRHAGKIIHIITGKGRRSHSGPVLKPLLKRLLQTELSKLVTDYALDIDEAGYRIRLK